VIRFWARCDKGQGQTLKFHCLRPEFKKFLTEFDQTWLKGKVISDILYYEGLLQYVNTLVFVRERGGWRFILIDCAHSNYSSLPSKYHKFPHNGQRTSMQEEDAVTMEAHEYLRYV